MFIKTAGFKKMIKEAYTREGLRVINNGDTYTLASGWWAMEIEAGFFPKKEKAAVIELTGELPEKGLGFWATKEGNQYEIVENSFFEVMEAARETEKRLNMTKLWMQCESRIVRVLQNPVTNGIVLINQLITQSISQNEMDTQNGECNMEGPLIGPQGDVIWRDNVMALRVFGTRTDEQSDTGRNVAMMERGLWK